MHTEFILQRTFFGIWSEESGCSWPEKKTQVQETSQGEVGSVKEFGKAKGDGEAKGGSTFDGDCRERKAPGGQAEAP